MVARLKLGQGAVLKKTFTQEHFDRFAELTGDHNPIHVDQEFAARTPFGKTVAHGMLLYGLISSILGTRLPGPGTVQLRQELSFFNPTFAGDEVTFLAWVTERNEPRVTLSTIAAKQDGTIACQGQTVVLLPGAAFSGEQWSPAPPTIDGGGEHASTKDARALGLEIGQKAAIKRVFTSEDLRARAELVGDANPMFIDGQQADASGREPLIPGDLLGGMISHLLGMKLPGPGTNWLKQTLVFPAQAQVGEEIIATVEVSRVRPDTKLVNLITTCTGPGGRMVCGGEALVLFRGSANSGA